jgi:zinc transporter 2
LFENEKDKYVPNLCALEKDKRFLRKMEDGKRAMKKLIFVSIVCFLFMAAEFVGGFISGSLAIVSDAAHLFSDVAGFLISFVSIYIS